MVPAQILIQAARAPSNATVPVPTCPGKLPTERTSQYLTMKVSSGKPQVNWKLDTGDYSKG